MTWRDLQTPLSKQTNKRYLQTVLMQAFTPTFYPLSTESPRCLISQVLSLVIILHIHDSSLVFTRLLSLRSVPWFRIFCLRFYLFTPSISSLLTQSLSHYPTPPLASLLHPHTPKPPKTPISLIYSLTLSPTFLFSSHSPTPLPSDNPQSYLHSLHLTYFYLPHSQSYLPSYTSQWLLNPTYASSNPMIPLLQPVSPSYLSSPILCHASLTSWSQNYDFEPELVVQ